jgi:hypothetical protein
MRLTIAAALLTTQAIPEAASSQQSKNLGGRPLIQNLKMLRHHHASMKKSLVVGKEDLPPIERSLLHEEPSSIENLFLSNSNNKPQVEDDIAPPLKNSKNKVECDPFTASQGELLDVGILSSCGSSSGGQSYYCKESEESSLGGFCVIGAEEGSASSSASRVLQYDFIGILCYPTSVIFNNSNCNCDGLNRIARTGTINCLPYDKCCFEAGANSFCGSFSFTINLVNGESESEESCYTFTEPYDSPRTICLGSSRDSSGDPACEITINNNVCSTCVIEDDGGMLGDEECKVFDCTNTGVTEAGMGNTCIDGSPLPLLDFIRNDAELEDEIAFPRKCGAPPFHQQAKSISVVVISVAFASGLFSFLMG